MEKQTRSAVHKKMTRGARDRLYDERMEKRAIKGEIVAKLSQMDGFAAVANGFGHTCTFSSLY